MPARFGQVVTPVYHQIGGDAIDHLGSGVLVKTSNKFWLFTASHVVEGTSPLWLPGRPFRQLTESIVFCPSPLDLAFVELSPDTATALEATGASFLSHDKIKLGQDDLVQATCVISGFPEKSVTIDDDSQHIMVDPTFVTTEFLSVSELAVARLDKELQLAGKVDQVRSHNAERLKKFRWHGLSGGAFWSSTSGVPALVGIVTMFDPARKLLIGTRIGPLIHEIARRLSAEHSPDVVVPKGYLDRHSERGPWLPLSQFSAAGQGVEVLLSNGDAHPATRTDRGWDVEGEIVQPIGWRSLFKSDFPS